MSFERPHDLHHRGRQLVHPELIEGFAAMRESLPVREIRLMDIDERRLAIMEGFCRRFAARLGLSATLYDVDGFRFIAKVVDHYGL